MKGLRLGLELPRHITVAPDDLTHVARAAESLGYDSLWLAEHVVVPLQYRSVHPSTGHLPAQHFRHDTDWPEAMVTLGFLARATSTIRIGTAVISLLTRDPLSLAKQAATVDLLSSGRLELGIGAGWLAEEGRLLGHPVDNRVERMAEAIEILRKAWSSDSFEHTGRFWNIAAVGVHPHPPQGAGLPIWIGGKGPHALDATAQLGTGTIQLEVTPEELGQTARFLRGRRPDLLVGVFSPLDPPEAAARALAYRQAGADLLVLFTSHQPRALVDRLASFRDEVAALS